ncbi:hypothetical protein [Nocardia abscessus]|uniref:hypothetical protein n=1 Tax=Nocardia abscessus TaxID=120957 RepID=UPI00245780E9|nr:hypothetical protein [Nocardia abscessus]
MRASKTPDPSAKHVVLSPRTVEALLDAGHALTCGVRRSTLRGPRPVFLYYLALTFESLSETLASGMRPVPQTPAQQLCLSLMITHAEEFHDARAATDSAPPIDFTHVHATLVPDDSHGPLAAVGRSPAGSECWFDFIALGDTLSARGMSAFFAPFESDDLAA